MALQSMKHMQTFCTVVEYGGFVGAQATLGMSQPAISTHIRDFEIRLGFQLCERGRGGFRLTEKGEVVYRRCREILNSLSDFEAELGELRDTLTGTLRIGLIDNTVTNPDLPVQEAIHRFYARKNEVTIQLVILPPEDLERELLSDNLHVAIGHFHSQHKNLSYRHLCEEQHQFYCGHRHPLFTTADEEVTLETLGHHALSTRTYLQQADLRETGEIHQAASVSNMEAQAILIASGRFLGFLPTHYAKQWVERGEMRSFDHLGLSWTSKFTLAMRQSPSPRHIVEAFVKDLETSLRRSGKGK